MSKEQPEKEKSGNMLTLLLSQADELDFSAVDEAGGSDSSSTAAESPSNLIVPGFEISKLFAIIEFGLAQGQVSGGILDGMNMMTRDEAKKAINGVFLYKVTSSTDPSKKQSFLVEMRREGKVFLGETINGKKVKPDVTVEITDKDMVSLATGKASPQMMFMKGRIKARGNLMLGLRS